MKNRVKRSWSPIGLIGVSALAATLMLSAATPSNAQQPSASQALLKLVPAGQFDTTDDALVKQLPGFRSEFATANGVRLHYVIGGEGPPVVLIPGHPETWWVYHKMMPALAERYTVIAVDIRGMGTSEVMIDGYNKKTMQEDIYQLVRQLGYNKVNIVGQDIGAMVAFSFAANHPEATTKVTLLDVPHPDDSWLQFPILPAEGSFGSKIDADHPPYPWCSLFTRLDRSLSGYWLATACETTSRTSTATYHTTLPKSHRSI